MYPTFNMMPGPSDQARTLQLAQYLLLDELYVAINAADRSLPIEERYQTAAVVAAREAYDASVAELVTLLGPNASCNQVDSDLYECFHNVYKDDVGCRPRCGWTLTQVQDYLERRRKEQAEDDAAAAASPPAA